MIFDKYLIFTNIMCNNCILSNIYIGTKEGVSKLEYVAISKTLSSKEGIYTNDMFAAATGNLTAQNFTWENLYEGTIDGGKDLSADSFFTKAEYKGAVKTGDNWTSGNWIKQ